MAVLTRRTAVVFLVAAVAVASEAAAGQPVQIGDPPPGRALIVFYRTWEYPAAALSYIVREGQTKLGMLSPGSYFIATVQPGLHTYAVRAERRDNMQIVAEADEVYYVRFELETGWLLYQPTLTPVEQRLFDQSSKSLKLSEPLASAAP